MAAEVGVHACGAQWRVVGRRNLHRRRLPRVSPSHTFCRTSAHLPPAGTHVIVAHRAVRLLYRMDPAGAPHGSRVPHDPGAAGRVLRTDCDSLEPMTDVILLALVGLLAGTFGSMVGLGGGVFVIPGLVLFLGVPIHHAISASLIAVVATSTTASVTYLRQGLANLRLAVTLEMALTLGALAGGFVGAMLDRQTLSAIFGGVMVVIALYVAIRRKAPAPTIDGGDGLGLVGACYYDRQLRCEVRYPVRRLPLGLLVGLIAGNVSGLLGVGGGFLTVPVTHLGMSVPMRATVATSGLMLGVTACAGALVYLARGLVDPVVTVPVVLGVTAGALLGSRLASRVRTSVLAVVLAVVLFALAIQMLLAAVGISMR